MCCRRILLVLFLIFLSYPALCQNPAKVKWDSAFYFYQKRDLQKALHYIDEFIELHPVANQGYIAKGEILGNLRRFRESNEVLTSLLARDPNVVDAYQMRGFNYLYLEQYDSSISNLSIAIAHPVGNDSLAYRARAYSYFRSGKFEKSKVDYDSADRFKPNDAEYFRNRGLNKHALGDKHGAIADLTKALRVNPHSYDVRQLRASFYFEIKDIAKCLEDCNTILSHDKNDQVALLLRGQCHMAQKNHKLAVTDFNACSDLDPGMKGLWLFRGVANFYLAQDDEAIADLTKALETSPNDPNIYYMLGECKNNLQPGTGCDDLRRSLRFGNADAARSIKDECK